MQSNHSIFGLIASTLLSGLITVAAAVNVTAADMPMMVHSDAKQFTEAGETNACALLITATSINGEFISTVIKIERDDSNETTLEYTVSAGHVDYRNGQETFDYVEEAWLDSGETSTRHNIVGSERGPSDYAYKAYYTTNAYELYSDMVESPFELTLITALHRDPYTQRFEQPFDAHVANAANDCLKNYQVAAQ